MIVSTRLVVSLTLIALLATGPAAAGQGAAKPRRRRFSLSGAFGGQWGRSHSPIEAAMTAAGLDDREYCFFCGRFIPHPFSRSGGIKGSLGLSYQLSGWLSLRLQHVPADLGWTSGYRATSGLGTRLDLFQTVHSTELLLGFSGGGPLCVSFGPALHAVRVSSDGIAAHSHLVLGTALRVSLAIPAHSAVFFEAGWQHDHVPTVTVGPFTVTDQVSDSIVTTFPATRVSMSYRAIMVGVGARF